MSWPAMIGLLFGKTCKDCIANIYAPGIPKGWDSWITADIFLVANSIITLCSIGFSFDHGELRAIDPSDPKITAQRHFYASFGKKKAREDFGEYWAYISQGYSKN